MKVSAKCMDKSYTASCMAAPQTTAMLLQATCFHLNCMSVSFRIKWHEDITKFPMKTHGNVQLLSVHVRFRFHFT
jgi:hypothetical protein